MSPSLLTDDRGVHAVRHTDESVDFDLDALMGELTHAVANGLHTVAAAADLAELLLARHKVAEAAQSLQRVQGECMRTAHLMRDARAFMAFRIGALDERVDVVALARACAEPLEGRVRVHVDAPIPDLCGNANALIRAFDEILVNAFQCGACNVELTLARDPMASAASIGFADDGPGLSISGERALQPFFSTLPGNHSGLGLALAARVVAAHGGELSVGANADPHGARIAIRLPLPAD